MSMKNRHMINTMKINLRKLSAYSELHLLSEEEVMLINELATSIAKKAMKLKEHADSMRDDTVTEWHRKEYENPDENFGTF